MKKFYITTPIFYVNAPPHLGHAYADVVADVVARYHRMQGDDTFFLSGTDEHGAKIVRAANAAGKSPAEFVATQREQFERLLRELGASNDMFIYTTDQERHWPGAQALWEKLVQAGDLYKASYRGMYCVGHEAFVTEKDLVDGVCPDHNQKPEVIEEENYFFRLSKYADTIRALIEKDELRILPLKRKNEVLAFLKEKIEDISFSRPSRDISWGIPVPHDADHTMYVWADALANYISALGYGSHDEKKFKKYWPADMHVIGKDILRFHAVYWPAMLLSAGIPLPRALYVTGMIISDGKKMSKTLGNVIDPHDIMQEYGNDPFRYFLMREISLGEDGDFTKNRFAEVYEGSLAHGLGNLVSRVGAMIKKYFPEGLDAPTREALLSVPQKRHIKNEVESTDVALVHESLDAYYARDIEVAYQRAMEGMRLTEAVTLLFDFYSLLDKYVQDYEPFRLAKTDPEKTSVVLWNLAWHLMRSAKLLEPFMPETADKIVKAFGALSIAACENIHHIQVADMPALFPSKQKTKNEL